MPILKKGFTLIELLIVISIIALLATFAIINFSSAQSKARDAERKSDLKNIQTALRLYYNDFGTYPASSGTQIAACDPAPGCAGACTYGSSWKCGTQTYMGLLPQDPTKVDYQYTFVSKTDYTLDACLENANDSSGIASGAWCSSGKMFEVKP